MPDLRADASRSGHRVVASSAAGRAAVVSPGLIATPDGSLGFGMGLLLRDPDGPVMQLVER